MRATWFLTALLAAALLSTTLAAKESWDNGEEGVLTDPAHEVSPVVDDLIRDFKPGMDTSELNWLTRFIRANCGGLRAIGDYRIVKPYTKWLSDTVQLTDEARRNMLQTLGALGDTSAAKVVMKYATDTTMRPLVRYEAAVAICLLGNAETGTRVLQDLALTKTVPFNWLAPWQFVGSEKKPVGLKSVADEKALTLYVRWLAERATDENTIAYSISYLLQKDDASKALAFRVAERALQSPDVYLPGQNDRRDLLSRLAWFGGKRGKALAAKYE
jgi:hypothetical protein